MHFTAQIKLIYTTHLRRRREEPPARQGLDTHLVPSPLQPDPEIAGIFSPKKELFEFAEVRLRQPTAHGTFWSQLHISGPLQPPGQTNVCGARQAAPRGPASVTEGPLWIISERSQ